MLRWRYLFGMSALFCGGLMLSFVGCSSPQLDSIVITPSTETVTLGLLPNGSVAPSNQQIALQYKAIGYFGNAARQTTKDITDLVTWTSDTPQMVTINSTGLTTTTGYAIGNASITASAPGFTGTIFSNESNYIVQLPTTITTSDVVSLALVPAASVVKVGASVQFTVVGTTGNGQTESLNSATSWTSSNANVATINANTGIATAVGIGTTSIVATYTNADGLQVTGSTTLVVSNSDIVSLSLLPAASLARVGTSVQFTLVGTTGTGQSVSLASASSWTSSNAGVATINTNTGIATAAGIGTTTIVATYTNTDGLQVTGSTTLVVSNSDVISIAVLPANSTAKAGASVQLTAVGTTGDGQSVVVTSASTWTSSTASVATINSNTGLATAVGTGTTTIVVTYKNADGTQITGSTTLIVQ